MRTCMLNCCRPLIRPTWDSEAQKTYSAFQVVFFFPASRFFVDVLCLFEVSGIFRRAVGTCFLLLWKNVPIFSWLILLQPIFRKISEWNSFAARDISLRPLIPRGSPVIDLGVKATNSDMTPEGGIWSGSDSYQKSDGKLSVMSKPFKFLGQQQYFYTYCICIIYISIYIHFKEVIFRQIRKPNSQTQGTSPPNPAVQLPFSYFTETTQGNFRALRRPEAANGR